MPNNDMEFEEEVVLYLNKNGKMRREKLIEDLIKQHTRTNEKGHQSIDSGYSKPTVNRKLNAMLKSGEILSLDYKELQKYGFQEHDKRAKYLFTQEGLKLKGHIDKVLQLLVSGDQIDKQIALKELNRYEKLYSFDESQLDLIAQNITSADAELTNKFLITLKDYILNRGKEIGDKNYLLKTLRDVLDKYSEPTGKNKVIRSIAILLLSHYKDEYIIEQLIKDATTLTNPLEVEEEYDLSSIAELIVSNPSRLFDTERQLMKEGKKDSVQFVSNIRAKAMMHLGMYDNPFEPANSTEW